MTHRTRAAGHSQIDARGRHTDVRRNSPLRESNRDARDERSSAIRRLQAQIARSAGYLLGEAPGYLWAKAGSRLGTLRSLLSGSNSSSLAFLCSAFGPIAEAINREAKGKAEPQVSR
jgi:hypothetical protein